MDSNSIIIINEAANTAPFWKDILLNILTGLSILASVFLAYICGLRSYFKQIEHERIMRRYLDNGIDLVLAGVNQALRVFIDNYLKALVTIKEIQESKKDLDVKFQSFDRNILEVTPYHKVEILVGGQIFWEVSQKLFALVDAQNVILSTKFKELVDDRFRVDTSSLLEKTNTYLDDSYKNFKKYDLLIQELQQLSSILEKQMNINWANFANFKNLKEVKACVGKLKDSFGTNIDTLKQQCKQNNK